MNKKITLVYAVSMAVGTMIGASIFSMFGLGAKIAKEDLPEAFIVSAFFAIAVAYSYIKFGSKIVSNAGPIAFILKGFGNTVTTGSLSILMWISYVISISLFAKGFAGYFLPLFKITINPLNTGLVESGIIIFFTVLNFFGSKSVGKMEFYIVSIKLSIIVVFILFGLYTMQPTLLTPISTPPYLDGLLHASVLFFLSYMGFGLITNMSENMINPKKNVPKAIIISIIVVLIIYVLVASVAVGNLTIENLILAKDNALAIATKPFLGKFGFLLISIGALFSISSALNATLYGGANISFSFAKNGDLPEVFERKEWFGTVAGLYITAILSLLFSLLFDIGGIAAITSSVFTVIYIFVIVSHLKLIKKIGGNKILVIINLLIVCIVFILLLYYQWVGQKTVFYTTILIFSASFLLEYFYRKIKNRSFKELELDLEDIPKLWN